MPAYQTPIELNQTTAQQMGCGILPASFPSAFVFNHLQIIPMENIHSEREVFRNTEVELTNFFVADYFDNQDLTLLNLN